MEFVDTVAIGIRDDLKNFDLSNCKDGIATSRDRFESASFLQKSKSKSVLLKPGWSLSR